MSSAKNDERTHLQRIPNQSVNYFIYLIFERLTASCVMLYKASCGSGESGGAMAICLRGPGSNPTWDLAFVVQKCCTSIFAEHWAFSKERVIEQYFHFLLFLCFSS